jgi:hypothetical protein
MTQRIPELLLGSLLLCCLGWSLAVGDDYYVDPTGSDGSPGTPALPWRSIGRVNEVDLEPGDCIHFQGGERFFGTLEFDADDSGAPGKEIIVTSYGRGRAIIEAGAGSALKADGCNHLILRNMEFLGLGRKLGNTADGICGAADCSSTAFAMPGWQTYTLMRMVSRGSASATSSGRSACTLSIVSPRAIRATPRT